MDANSKLQTVIDELADLHIRISEIDSHDAIMFAQKLELKSEFGKKGKEFFDLAKRIDLTPQDAWNQVKRAIKNKSPVKTEITDIKDYKERYARQKESLSIFTEKLNSVLFLKSLLTREIKTKK